MILVLCGPAGAGKSSIALRLMEELDDAHLISSDSFKRKAYDRIMREVEGRRGKQEYLVIDATFYKKRWRDNLREIAGEEEKVVTVFIECSLEACLRRNQERETPIPEAAIHIIWKGFERPDAPDIHVNTEEFGVEQAVDKILKELRAFQNPSFSTA
jgi:adenylylsulfate kinase-like enzyme